MKYRIAAIAFLFAAARVAFGADTNYAVRLDCELQTAGPKSLKDVNWTQGQTPLMELRVLRNGRPVVADTNTSVRMLFAASSTAATYAVATNYWPSTNAASYFVQWGAIGTNTAGTGTTAQAWYYTVYFDKISTGETYWSGNGALYIEKSTSLADGLNWIAATNLPRVAWANVLGDPASNPSLAAYLAETAGEDTVARAGVASNAAAIALANSNLTAHTSNTSNPHSVTAAQIGAASQADFDLLSAADVPVGCAGGFWNEDYFTMETVPYAYTATSIGSTSQVNSILAAPRVYTGENGLLLQPTIVRQSSYTNDLIYGNAVNFTLIETNGHDVAEWTDGATNGTVGTLTATLGEFSRTVTCTHAAGADITNWWWVADVKGSLRALVNTAMLARAAQTSMSQYVYASGAYSTTNFVRSENCWAYGVDLTSASPWNSMGAQFYAGTAITPQHALLATHWPRAGIAGGTVFRFIDATNGLHLATAADRRDLSDDLTVVRFAEALPEAIVPAKVLGATDKGYFLGKENLFGDPGYRLVYLDQGERAWIANDIIATAGLFWDETAYIRGEDSPFGQEEAVGGDSGNPVFLVIGTNTVLYTIFRSSVTGPSIAAHAEEIEAALSAMGGSVHTNLSYVPMNTFINYDVPAVPAVP